MTIITLDEIQAAHERVAEMIESYKAAAARTSFFEYQGKRIPLASGEIYGGTIISADPTHSRHVILLPGDQAGMTWDAAQKWAESIGGEMPDRVEGALLFATLKSEFQGCLYWLRERLASNSGYAWFQDFSDGGQGCSNTNNKFRVRVVRRSIRAPPCCLLLRRPGAGLSRLSPEETQYQCRA